jgi:hypothetical protein
MFHRTGAVGGSDGSDPDSGGGFLFITNNSFGIHHVFEDGRPRGVSRSTRWTLNPGE